MIRRFNAGMGGDIGGVKWRVVQGKKAENDMRLDILVPRWTAVSMGVGFLFADMFHENEDLLYPPSRGYQGGDMYLRFCEGATRVGWETAYDMLKQQRVSKRAA
jgi:hypothetical protein